jgi:putative phosphoribosyl transferase
MNEIVHPGFKDRREAGRLLVPLVREMVAGEDVLILALPRGGVPVAAEIAEALGKPFDLLVVRKLGVPGHEEFAMGAIAGGGMCVLNDRLVSETGSEPGRCRCGDRPGIT